MDSTGDRPMAVISYAHGRYDAQIVALSDQLRVHGVDCEVDAYEDSPAKGWLQWMEDMMMSRTVLAVCTAEYAERLRGDAPPGVGRGAAWEGRIIKQRVYDGQGKNEGVVPIVFAASDRDFIPPFLSDVSYYDLSAADGFEKLYRRLTRQPLHFRPPLGEIVTMAPAKSAPTADFSNCAVFTIPGDGRVPGDVIELSHDRGQVTVKVRVPMESARRLRTLADAYGRKIAFAYRLDCYAGHLRYITHSVDASGDMVTIILDSSALPAAGRVTDMSYNGVSADDIALMRARRILLNEPLPTKFRNDPTMDSFVAGRISSESELDIRHSNIPEISQRFKDDNEFAAIARLDSIIQLVLSVTVERIEQLDVVRNAGTVTIDFAGMRARVYSNRQPTRLELHEDCNL